MKKQPEDFTKKDNPQKGDLRVWWVPQVPMEAFRRHVKDIEQAKFLLDTLADYDLFQFEKKVKPDYTNAGGLEVFNGEEWEEWENEDGDDITAAFFNS